MSPRQELDRDPAIEMRFVGGEDDAHAAGAEPADEDVAADPIAGDRGRGLRRRGGD